MAGLTPMRTMSAEAAASVFPGPTLERDARHPVEVVEFGGLAGGAVRRGDAAEREPRGDEAAQHGAAHGAGAEDRDGGRVSGMQAMLARAGERMPHRRLTRGLASRRSRVAHSLGGAPGLWSRKRGRGVPAWTAKDEA